MNANEVMCAVCGSLPVVCALLMLGVYRYERARGLLDDREPPS